MVNELNIPEKVYFKTGSLPVALRELTEIYDCKRALIVTDAGRHAAGAAAAVTRCLEKGGMRTAEYYIEGDPVSAENLRGVLPKLQEFQPDVIIGVGHSAEMSAAKILRICRMHPELDPADTDALLAAASKETMAKAERDRSKPLLVLVPTAFADGSQNTAFAKILPGTPAADNNAANAAVTLCAFGFIPEISVTDAQFVKGMPADRIRTDTEHLLALCDKALASTDCSEYRAGLLEEAKSLIRRYTADAAKGEPFAFEKLMNAASIAGCAFCLVLPQTLH